MSNSFYRNIYFDYQKGKIYLTETVNGERFKDTYEAEFDYWATDPSGESFIKDIYGTPMAHRIAKSPDELKALSDSGEKLCESDIPQDLKFLQKRYGTMDELTFNVADFNIGILDIEVASENEFPVAKNAKYPINLISIKLLPQNKVYTFALMARYMGSSSAVEEYTVYDTEKNLIENFIKFFRKKNIDIVTGWNLINFDITYLINRINTLGITTSLSPVNKYSQNKKTGEWSIPGLTLIDYIDLYKTFTQFNRESYSLEYIANFEIGEGKLEFEGTINNLYKTDWDKYVEYNVQDVNLIDKIDKKLRYIELAITVCLQSLVPINKYAGEVQRATGSILKYMHKKGLVMSDRQSPEVEQLPGAYVEAKIGFFKNLLSFDVESMYPHMIMKYNISPETLRLNPEHPEQFIRTPVRGIYYDKKKGILPEIIEKIFAERKYYNKLKKEEKDPVRKKWLDLQQYTRKIWMNSLYGVLGNEYFHFYNINNAKVVTLGGQDLIKYLRDSINDYFANYFHKSTKLFKTIDEKNKLKNEIVVLLDTDSLYLWLEEVHLKLAPNETFLEWAAKFDKEFFIPFIQKILKVYADNYDVVQNINFRREKIISKMFILAKKKYGLEIIDNEGVVCDPPEIKITGIEIVRTSTPAFCRGKIKIIVDKIFKAQDNKNKDEILTLLREIKREFKQQPIEKIAFPRGISDYDEYAKDVNFNSTEPIPPKGCPIGNRAAINWNFMIEKCGIQGQPIANGTKMKFIYVKDNNPIHTDVIGWVGNYPEKLSKLFTIDYDKQWITSFQNVIDRFFEVLDWGNIDLNAGKLNKFMAD